MIYAGCSICHAGVCSGDRPQFLFAADQHESSRLYRCTDCNAWWMEQKDALRVVTDATAHLWFGPQFTIMNTSLACVYDYLAEGKPIVCELDVSPYLCEFWSKQNLLNWNLEYGVPRYAPGYWGFATSGGGEMFAISPIGEVVCLPFIGMDASEALVIAESWSEFTVMLHVAN